VGEEVKRFAAILTLALVCACGDGATEQATKTHARLDAAMLRSIPDADVEQAVVDYVSSKLDGDEDREAQILKGLPAGARATWLTWIVEGEVNNGGFNRYYYNTAGKFATAPATIHHNLPSLRGYASALSGGASCPVRGSSDSS
jgi:hypothetical protein